MNNNAIILPVQNHFVVRLLSDSHRNVHSQTNIFILDAIFIIILINCCVYHLNGGLLYGLIGLPAIRLIVNLLQSLFVIDAINCFIGSHIFTKSTLEIQKLICIYVHNKASNLSWFYYPDKSSESPGRWLVTMKPVCFCDENTT